MEFLNSQNVDYLGWGFFWDVFLWPDCRDWDLIGHEVSVSQWNHIFPVVAYTETNKSIISDTCLCLWSDGPVPGWQAVPAHDPQVQDAANHAIKTIQQRSNSLFPYELLEVVHAKAEVSASYTLFLFRKNNCDLRYESYCVMFRN